MFRVQRMGHCDVQLGICAQIGPELVQGRACHDRFGARGFTIQPTLPTPRWLAQTVRLLDDAEQQWRPSQYQLVTHDGRSGGHALVLQCNS